MDQFNKPLLGSRIDPEHSLSRGLVLCLLMNEGSGNRTYDISGNGNNGIFDGNPLWNPGDRGQALAFDGLADYVDCGNASILNSPNELTIIVWLYQIVTAGQRVLISKWLGVDFSYFLDLDPTYLRLFLSSTGVDQFYETSSVAVPINAWGQIAGIYDGLSMRLFMNGKKVASANTGGIPASINSSVVPVYIGRTNVGYFNSLISSVSIYNRALSAQEVQELYINPYAMIWDPKIYYIPNDPVYKFTAEHIDTHFIAESIDTHFIAEA